MKHWRLATEYKMTIKQAFYWTARGRKTLWILTLLCFLVGMAWVTSNYKELVEAFNEATCGAPCPKLSSEQLRVQVIKAYLHNQLNNSIERKSAGGYQQIALLQPDLTKEDIKQEIENETLVRALTTNTTILETHAQINTLSIETFVNNPTIVFYSLSRRTAQIIPTRSIQATTPDDIEEYMSNGINQRGKFQLHPFNWWEKRRGYGQHFFWLTNYAFIDLGCCDGLGDHQGLSPNWFKKNNLKNLNYADRAFVIVSNRGAILNRYPSD